MDYYVEPIVLNSDDIKPNNGEGDLFTRRKNVWENCNNQDSPTVTIIVMGYNRLEKTKRCIESIIKYTNNIPYELILVDNGSDDGTYEYFQTVPIENKIIIKVTKNIGSSYGTNNAIKKSRGKYLASISNDIVVTKNWLTNIIKCYESDSKIGLVVPISTNISNLQEPNQRFKNLKQIFEFGEKNNVHNPLKWKERVRVVTPILVQRQDMFQLVGSADTGFFHDFLEDDLCIRIRRAGYKIILCEDSFVHHDHDFRNLEDKKAEEFENSLKIGREDYKTKYHGLDAWDDVNNYEVNLINMLKVRPKYYQSIEVLGVDVRMGTPVLEIKNKLREHGKLDVGCNAFTTNAKYFTDLQTICDGNVYCDRVDFIFEYFSNDTFDYVILGEPLNSYPYPIKLLQRLIECTKENGQILIKIINTNNLSKLIQLLGYKRLNDDSLIANLLPEEVKECANFIGASKVEIRKELLKIDEQTEEFVRNILVNSQKTEDVQLEIDNLLTENYLISIEK